MTAASAKNIAGCDKLCKCHDRCIGNGDKSNKFAPIIGEISEKIAKKIWRFRNIAYLCNPEQQKCIRDALGSIAQLVQSVCLTSRGSGVRLPLLPQQKACEIYRRFFCIYSDLGSFGST